MRTLRVNGRTLFEILRDSKDRQIVIWGESPDLTDAVFLAEKMTLMNIEVSGIVDVDNTCREVGYKLLDVNRLDPNRYRKKLLIVVLHEKYKPIYEYLVRRGFLPGEDFRWIKRYGQENLLSCYSYDPLLGFNSIGAACYPGFEVLGDPDDSSAVRIVILGGSSTDPNTFVFKSWPEYFYDICLEEGISVTIFNGAVTGYTASQELIKLTRDVMSLSPDMVVSFSGINQNHLVKGYPFFTDYILKAARSVDLNSLPTMNRSSLLGFQAPKFSEKDFDKFHYWFSQEQTMNFFCSTYNVHFKCFLQPNLMSKCSDKLLQEEREYLANRSFMGRFGLTPSEYSEISREFRNRATKAFRDKPWAIDLSDIYDEVYRSVYLDAIHVDELGNKMAANAVWEYTSKEIDSLYREK